MSSVAEQLRAQIASLRAQIGALSPDDKIPSWDVERFLPAVRVAREAGGAVACRARVEAGATSVPCIVAVTGDLPPGKAYRVRQLHVRLFAAPDGGATTAASSIAPPPSAAVDPPVALPPAILTTATPAAAVPLAPAPVEEVVVDESAAAPLSSPHQSCRLCKKRFTLFRKEKACGVCAMPTCASCMTSVQGKSLGWKQAKTVCSDCLPELSRSIREAPVAKDDPLRTEMQRRESTAIDTSLLKLVEQNMASTHCHHCGQLFSAVRLERQCLECETLNCHLCCAAYRLGALGQKDPRSICVECLPALQKKLGALAKGPGPDAQRALREQAQLEMVLRGNLARFVNYERSFTEAELRALDKGKLKCAVCDAKYSLFRSPRKCAQCTQTVCQIDAYDILVAKNLIGKGPTFCSTCYGSTVRSSLLQQTRSNPGITDDVLQVLSDADDALLHRDASLVRHPLEADGVKESTLKRKTCPLCQQPFTLFRNPDRCRKCARVVCGSMTCSGQFFVPTLSAHLPVTLCCDCVGVANTTTPPRGSMAIPGGITNVRLRELVTAHASCRFCQSSFSFFLRPNECHKCKLPSCRHCIAPYVTCTTLGLDGVALCRLCIPELKVAVVQKQANNPEAARADLETLNEALQRVGEAALPAIEASSSQALVSPRKVSPRANAPFVRAAATTTAASGAVGAPPAASEADSCALCSHSFSLLRKPKQCSECSRPTCGQCVGLYFLKSLGEEKARYICLECLPRIRDTMLAKERGLPPPEPGAPQTRGAKEASAVAISFAGNMFPAVAQAEFSKEEVALFTKGNVSCQLCSEPFSLRHPPFRCSECKSPACASCCFHFRFLHFFLGKTRPATLCRSCWPSVASMLESVVGSTPQFGGEVHDLRVQGEFFLVAQDRVTRTTRLPASADLSAIAKQSCKVCTKRFNLFRPPASCGYCDELVCPGVACSGLLYVPEQHALQSTVVCSACLPDAQWKRQPLGQLPPAAELTASQLSVLTAQATLACHSCAEPLGFLTPPFSCSLGGPTHSVCRTCSRGPFRGERNVCRRCLAALPGNEPARKLLLAPLDARQLKAFIDGERRDQQEDAAKKAAAAAAAAATPAVTAAPPVVATTPAPVVPVSSPATLTKVVPIQPDGNPSCSVCAKKYSAFRKAQTCSECRSSVCASCSNEQPAAAPGAKPTWMCVNCEQLARRRAKQAREEAVPAAAVPVAAAAPRAVEDEPLATILPSISSLELGSCATCQRMFGFFRVAKTCSECDKRSCSQCIGFYMLKSLAETQPRHVCNACLVGVCRKVHEVAASAPAGSPDGERATKEGAALALVLAGSLTQPSQRATFNEAELALIGAKKGVCAHCSRKFDLFRTPRKCTECTKPVCSKCSALVRLAGRVQDRRELVLTCAGCWPKLRVSLLRVDTRGDRRVYDHVRRMVACTDAALVVAAMDSDLELSLKGQSVGKLKCYVCSKGFRLFRPPDRCAVCSQFVCDGNACSGRCLIPAVSSVALTTVCRTCLPRQQVLLPRPGSVALHYVGPLLPDQAAVVAREQPCKSCKRPFTYYARPFRCASCAGDFCHSCSLASELRPDRQCKACAMNGSHQALLDFWVGFVDSSEEAPDAPAAAVIMADPVVVAAPSVATAAPAVLSPRAAVAPATPDAVLVPVPTVEVAACKECQRPYAASRTQRKCAACNDLYCSARECGSKVVLPYIDPKNAVAVCASCAAIAGRSPRSLAAAPSPSSSSRLITMTLRGKTDDRAPTSLTLSAASAAAAGRCQLCKAPAHVSLLPAPEDPCAVCRRQACGGCGSAVVLRSAAAKGAAAASSAEARTVCRDCAPTVRRLVTAAMPAAHGDEVERLKHDANWLALVLAAAEAEPMSNVPSGARADAETSGACHICEESFSLNRIPFQCTTCGEMTCERDCHHLPLVGYLSDPSAHNTGRLYVVCRSCWPQARTRLESTVREGSSEHLVAAQAELVAGEAWIGGEGGEGSKEFDVEGSCAQCHRELTLWRPGGTCHGCKRLVCRAPACGGLVYCSSYGELEPLVLCAECVTGHSETIQVAVKPSASHRYPLSSAAREVVSNGADCSVCEKPFSFFRRPHECSSCETDVCAACSNADVSSSILGLERVRVCKPCMPGLRTRIEEQSAENPRLADLAESEVAALEKAIETEVVDEGETTTPALIAERRNAAPVAAVVTAPTVALPANDSVCPLCAKGYNLFRKKKCCANCARGVCSSCSHEFKCPSLGWSEQRRICDDCLAVVMAQLDDVTTQTKQLQRDRKSVRAVLARRTAGTAAAPTNVARAAPELEQGSDDEDEEGGSEDSFDAALDAREQAAVTNGTLRCAVCDHRFGILRQPHRCGKCSDVVCQRHAANVPGLASLLGWIAPGTVCSVCWAGVRGEIRETVEPMSAKRQQAWFATIEATTEELDRQEDDAEDDESADQPVRVAIPPLALGSTHAADSNAPTAAAVKEDTSTSARTLAPVLHLLSPRYSGPGKMQCVVSPPGNTFDWASVLAGGDLSREPARSVTKQQLEHLRIVRERLQALRIKYGLELAQLAQDEMRAQAEEDAHVVSVALLEVAGLRATGPFFITLNGGELADRAVWGHWMTVHLDDPGTFSVRVDLIDAKQRERVAACVVTSALLGPDFNSGAVENVTVPLVGAEGGTALLGVKRGVKRNY